MNTSAEEIPAADIRELCNQIREREESRIRDKIENQRLTEAENLAVRHQEMDQL